MKRQRHGICATCGRGIHLSTLGAARWWLHDVAANHAAVARETTEATDGIDVVRALDEGDVSEQEADELLRRLTGGPA